MRVLYFDSKFRTPRAASPTRAYAFARHLVEQGHEVTMVAREPVEADGDGRRGFLTRERVDGIDVVWLKVPYRQAFTKAQRMLAYGGYMAAATAVGPVLGPADVVYASSVPLTIGVPGVVASRLRRAPFVFEIQDLWPAVPVGLGYLNGSREIAAAEWLERRLYEGSERVVVCSAGAVEHVAALGVPRERIVLIPNFSDLELFRPGRADEEFRRRHGLEGKFVAVYAGGMGASNGVLQLADAAAELLAAGEDSVALVVLGNGAQRGDLERAVRDHGLSNLRLLPPVARAEMPGIVGAADVTLTIFAPNPVLEANSPNKFFASLAAGKPVVVNLDGWLRLLVEKNDAGVWTPGGDAAGLARTLARLAREPERVAEMGRNARRLAEREFGRDLLADRLVDTLQEVAERRRAPVS